MTDRAILRESSGHVVRILCSVEVVKMTRHAGLIQSIVHTALMAVRAGQRCMTARQWELRGRCMVKTRPLPRGGIVAICTGLGKQRRFVIRIARRHVIVLMARDTGLIQSGIYSAFVAVGAGQRCMTACQRELRIGRVVEVRSHPPAGGMAHSAILRESSGYMVRILCSVEVVKMTRHAGLIQSIVHTALMAVRAGQRCVASG